MRLNAFDEAQYLLTCKSLPLESLNFICYTIYMFQLNLRNTEQIMVNHSIKANHFQLPQVQLENCKVHPLL